MAIEIGGKGPLEKKDLMPAVIIPGGGRDWSETFFNFGLFALILVLAVSIGLFIWQNIVLDSRLSSLNSSLQALQVEQKTQDAEKFVLIQDQLRNLREILLNHVYGSKIFPWLEKLTHPRVSFSSINISFKEAQVSLTGVAATYEVLAQQVILFENDERVMSIQTESIQPGSDGIKFSLEIFFDPKLIQR